MAIVIKSSQIITYNDIVNGYLLIENGKITDILNEYTPTNTDVVYDYSNEIVAPGLIDPHLHGFMGWNVSKTTDYHQVLGLAKALLTVGITSFLPSCISTTYMEDNVAAIAEAIEKQQDGANIIGVYMEGPFYNPSYNGGTPIQYFRKPSLLQAKEFYAKSKGYLKCIGLACELEQADEVIDFMVNHNVKVGIAHSGATYDQTIASIEKGISIATHSFNAMRSIHHREVGVTGAILLNQDIYNEINCDFIHVCPQMIEILFKMKPIDKIIMMTDSDSMSGMKPGKYLLNDVYQFLEKDGKIHLEDGTIYGSGRSIIHGLKNLSTMNISLPDLFKLGSYNAAKYYGIENHKGSIAINKDADICIMSNDFTCLSTFVKGVQVYDINNAKDYSNPQVYSYLVEEF